MWNGKVPFSTDTDKLLNYAGHGDINWKDNFEFQDTLVFCGFTRGRSAAHAHFKSYVDSKEYVVFLTDLADLIKDQKFVGGVASGTFTFTKRGTNYGLKMVSLK